MMGKKSSAAIAADSAKCAGCIICQLRCSVKFDKAFNPAYSAIIIDRSTASDCEYQISFTEKCDGCGICVRYCPYSALAFADN